jgi:tetratricopeptide (TPR) repeat protein
MRARPRVSFLAAMAVALFASNAARADDAPGGPADASNAAAAQALFDDGVKLMEAGRFAEACPKLASSERLDPGAGTLLNLGTCYEKNGQIASAWATFQEAESTARRASHDDWADRAHAHVAALEPRLQRVIVAVAKEAVVPGLKVTRDGVEVEPSAWGVPIPIDPGEHEVRAVAPAKREWSAKVVLSVEGSLSTVNVPPLENEPVAAAPPAPAPVPPPPPAPFWTTQRIVAGAVAGGGVLAVAVGSGLGLSAKSKYDDALDHDCPNHGTQCTAAGVQEGQDAHGLATASTVVFVVGLAALGAGAAFFFVPLGGSDASPSTAAVRVTPTVAPDRTGLTLQGTW